MTKNIVTGILFLIVAGLVYLLVKTIEEPIQFRKVKQKRELAVIQRLKDIRIAQEAYNGITGEYASDFDSLKKVLTTDSFMLIQVFGDPDDPNSQELLYDTTYRAANDSIANIMTTDGSLGLNLDSLRYVPYSKDGMFEIAADTVTYQSINVWVVEVGTKRKVFMGPFADAKYGIYDNSYDPESYMKFGDMLSPNLSGNWE